MAWFLNINKWFINIKKWFVNIKISFISINKCWTIININKWSNINKWFSNINYWAPPFVCWGSLYMWNNNEYPLHMLRISGKIWPCCMSDVNFKCIFDLFSISIWFPWHCMWIIYLTSRPPCTARVWILSHI